MNVNWNQLADFVGNTVTQKMNEVVVHLLGIFQTKKDAARQQVELQSLKAETASQLQKLKDENARQLQTFKVESDRQLKSLKKENARLKKLLEENGPLKKLMEENARKLDAVQNVVQDNGRKLHASRRVIAALLNQRAAPNQPPRSRNTAVMPTISFKDMHVPTTYKILLRAYPSPTQENLRAFFRVEKCEDMYTWKGGQIDFVCDVLKEAEVIGYQKTKGKIWNERCRFICYCLGIEFVPHPEKTAPEPW